MQNDRDNSLEEKLDLFKLIQTSSSVSFDCSEKNLKPTDIELLADILKNKPKTEKINLNYNEIGNEGMAYIGDIILNCPNLKEIRLQCNSIRDEGIFALINKKDIKQRLPSLNIELARNGIGDTGLLEIRDFLSPSSRLSLLSGNQIWDKELFESTRTEAVKALQEQTNYTSNSNNMAFKNTKDKKNQHEEEKTNEIGIGITPPK